jgi:adenosylcobinamide kinase / adenosylcobinamide-phosphate guanylyltransferase
MKPRFVLVGGGARSGKSRFAQALAMDRGRRRLFVATAQAFDDEMRDRIDHHRQERGAAFATVEEPLALPETIATLGEGGADVLLVDCLTLWLSNLLMHDPSAAPARRRIDDLVRAIAARRCHVILVSNEVGLGIVPEAPLARLFRDLCGYAHQRLGDEADEIYAALLGQILRLRPDPVLCVARPAAADRLR